MTVDQRVRWIDIARGMAIILVVIGHVWRGLSTARILDNVPLFALIDGAIYLFHMPLFFILSGLMFESQVLRRGFAGSLKRRTRSLLYPYLIWTYINAALLLMTASVINRPPISPVMAMLYPLFPAEDIYWFLWALFQIQTIASLLMIYRRPWAYPVAFAILSVPLLIVTSKQIPGIERGALSFAPFFLIGLMLAKPSRQLGSRTGAILGGLAFVAAEALVSRWPGAPLTPIGYIPSVVASIGFVYAIAWAGARLPARAAGLLAQLGVASMAIYVTHVFVMAAVRIVLARIGIHSVPVHLTLGSVTALALPYAFYLTARRMRLLGLLGLGQDSASAPTRVDPVATIVIADAAVPIAANDASAPLTANV